MRNMLMCKCAEKWQDVAPLVLRLAIGAVFFMHGWQKLTDPMLGVAGVTGFLGTLGFPLPGVFAILLIAGEILGGLGLMLGLFTHWAGKVCAVIGLVALFSVHFSHGFWMKEGGYEYILVLFAGAFALMITGAGKYSLDHKLMKK